MHHDDVARLVDLENPVCEKLVHAVVIGPRLPCSAPISRLVLLVVEQSVELVFRVCPPMTLVFQDVFIFPIINLVDEPDWHNSASMITLELFV